MERVNYFMERILEYLQNVDISYKKTYPKDENCVFSEDYSFKNFWIDYLKISRKFFRKYENFNLKSIIESEYNSNSQISEFKIITNEIATILEENSFIENLIEILADNKLHSEDGKIELYVNYAINAKNILSFIALSKGGINFLSKNFDVTMILRNLLIQMTESLVTNPETANYSKEENIFPVKLMNNFSINNDNNDHHLNERYSKINEILIKTNGDYNDNLLLKYNLLQLRYLIELQFIVNR